MSIEVSSTAVSGRLQFNNDAMAANLATIVVLHDCITMPSQAEIIERTQDYPLNSVYGFPGITIDRSADVIAEYYTESVTDIAEATGDGLAVDFGAGNSDYLYRLRELGCSVLAIDRDVGLLELQASSGVDTLKTDGFKIDLPDESVRTFNASYSLPYWAQTPEQATEFLDEVIRVVEPGTGRAYIGSIVHVLLHRVWEAAVSAANFKPRSYHGLWDVDYPNTAIDSYIASEFIRSLLDIESRGDAEIDLFRVWKNRSLNDSRSNQLDVHIPNFVKIRRSQTTHNRCG